MARFVLCVCLVVVPVSAAAQHVSGPPAVPASRLAVPPVDRQRPAALVPLYVSFGTLQALDLHSTLRALDAGGREANPLMGLAGGSAGGMIALKAGAAAATIFASEKLWKHHRVAAVLLMTALDSAYAAVVVHNYRLGEP